ncbi:MAG: DUF6851 domain-containing protein [Cyanobacteriota bacterium]
MKKYLPIGIAAATLLIGLPAKATGLSMGEVNNTVTTTQANTANTSGAKNNVLLWNSIALEAVKNTKFAPPMMSRAFSMLHTSMFDAWSAYDPTAVGTQLDNTYQRPETENTFANKNQAISYAAYNTLKTLFPTQASTFDSLMSSLGYDTSYTFTDTTTAAGIGNLAAHRLLDFRQNDGSNQLGTLNPSGRPYSEPILAPNYTPYQPVNTANQLNDINHWQPQGKQQFLLPQWGSVTPFALESGLEFRPTHGPKTMESDPEGFYAQAKEIYEMSKNLTDEQKLIATYWEAGAGTVTPPGMWNDIAQEISQRDNNDLDKDVKMFFALNNTLFDSGVAAWDTKRAFDSVRPVTVINQLLDPNWQPFLGSTPPHPDFVSGHSTYSASGAEILKLFTGSDYYGGSYTENDVTLSWNTFTDAAEEGGMSRLYGGIHFMDANVAGQEMGRKVAQKVWDKVQGFFSGLVSGGIDACAAPSDYARK